MYYNGIIASSSRIKQFLGFLNLERIVRWTIVSGFSKFSRSFWVIFIPVLELVSRPIINIDFLLSFDALNKWFPDGLMVLWSYGLLVFQLVPNILLTFPIALFVLSFVLLLLFPILDIISFRYLSQQCLSSSSCHQNVFIFVYFHPFYL